MKSNFNPWPAGIVVFFLCLICSLAAVVTIAATHREGMVNDNYYEQELKYQDQINDTARARKCGVRVALDPAGHALVVNLPASQVDASFTGEALLYRPAAPELDRIFPLKPDRQGNLRLDLSRLARGLWEAHVHWTAGGQGYYLEQKLTLP